MELLREMTALQEERGWLDDETLRGLAKRHRVPLYRVEGLVSFYTHFRRTPPPRVRIDVCRDVVCAMAGGEDRRREMADRLVGREDVELCEVSCLGRCDAAPAIRVNDVSLPPVSLADLDAVLGLVEGNEGPSPLGPGEPRVWQCDPYETAAARYGTARGLVAVGTVRETCVERLSAANLRGMGGAGFPTGRKWDLVAAEPGETKYVICNADESEPGTFKDRVVLAELPHLVVEGMILAGLTVGAERGIVFIRHEYEPELRALEAELERAREAGALGPNACGSGRAFEIEVFVSPGGYILGEETALLEALEDKRGEPRNKPPYPGQQGLWGKPTLINNVETFALASSIVHHGPEWWADRGAGEFAGLKFVSVSGDVANPGVYEIPVGTTVRDLIDLAGGVDDDRELLAFLPGGASSRFLPASAADTPLDFDAMRAAGSMLGTGAVVVFAEGRDLFALATNLVRFFRNESCGKCVPCRIGSHQAVMLLEEVGDGTRSTDELATLQPLGETLEQTSICGLGQVALVPVLSMLERFPHATPTHGGDPVGA